MNRHLSEAELDLVLCGEPLAEEQSGHLHGCLACRRRVEAFGAAVAADVRPAPDDAIRERVRQAALARWSTRPRRRLPLWLAAAAILVLAVLPAVLRMATAPRVNVETVLQEVDTVLDRDPLAAMAPEDVVRTVVPADVNERSVS